MGVGVAGTTNDSGTDYGMTFRRLADANAVGSGAVCGKATDPKETSMGDEAVTSLAILASGV